MTNLSQSQKLEALVQEAIDGGWRGDKPVYDDNIGQWYLTDGDGGYVVPSMIEILYAHDFAKALWGNKKERGPYKLGWIHHLQQMVISKDPIDYAYATLCKDTG